MPEFFEAGEEANLFLLALDDLAGVVDSDDTVGAGHGWLADRGALTLDLDLEAWQSSQVSSRYMIAYDG